MQYTITSQDFVCHNAASARVQDGWIPLQCPDCGAELEDSPADLPPTGNDFTCEHCRSTRPISAFVQTQEGLDMLEQFHG